MTRVAVSHTVLSMTTLPNSKRRGGMDRQKSENGSFFKKKKEATVREMQEGKIDRNPPEIGRDKIDFGDFI